MNNPTESSPCRPSGPSGHRLIRTPSVRRALALTVVGAVAVTLAACGSSSSASTTSTTKAPTPSRSGTGGSGASARRFPVTSGEIASISGTSLEVQSTTSQTTVNYTSTTTFEQTVSATVADVTVGSCISAFGKPTSGTSSSSTIRAFGEPVTATTVTISQPTSAGCTGGFGGFGGGPGGAGGGFPRGGTGGTGGAGGGSGEGFPGAGSGSRPAGGFAGGTFGAASGSVTAVSGSSVTISEKNPRTGTTSSVVVTLTASTTFTQRTTASATDLAVGKCASAIGPANSTGAVTASSITISTPGANGCTSGFGFRGAAAGGPAAGTPGGTTGA